MFGIHDLLFFVSAGLLLNITPGPDLLYVKGRSTAQGWSAGAAAALGIGAGFRGGKFAAWLNRCIGGSFVYLGVRLALSKPS